MPSYKIRKGFPRISFSDDGSSTGEIELVCVGYADEKEVLNAIDYDFTIGNRPDSVFSALLPSHWNDWRVESISIHPSPLNLPYNAVSDSGSDDLVFIARVILSLADFEEYYDGPTRRLRGDRVVTQTGQVRMASMMGQWPSTLPADPWIGNGSIECDIEEGKRLDISGKPQVQAVGQLAITATELRHGTFPNFKVNGDVIDAQGTRNSSEVWEFAAHTLLFQSVEVVQVKHSLFRWTFKFLFDPKKFLDQIPFSMPLTSGPVPVNETTEIVAAVGDTPAIENHHFLAVWSSPYRIGDWTLATLGLEEDYWLDLITGDATSSPV